MSLILAEIDTLGPLPRGRGCPYNDPLCLGHETTLTYKALDIHFSRNVGRVKRFRVTPKGFVPVITYCVRAGGTTLTY